MSNRSTLEKIARLSGRSVIGGLGLAIQGTEMLNGIATDFLGASKGLANEFSGASSSDIGPKTYNKATKAGFCKALAVAKWADKRLK